MRVVAQDRASIELVTAVNWIFLASYYLITSNVIKLEVTINQLLKFSLLKEAEDVTINQRTQY